ncbi:hypothetical protein [Brucella sp. IR073]|uniref:hypothetical protein n=1 Tax=unclassified Brucella TaxID=2632610 RepID=UPI003B982496
MTRSSIRDRLVDLATVLIALRALSAPLAVPLLGMLALAGSIATEPRSLVDFYRTNKAITICLAGVILFSLVNALEYHYRPVYYGLLAVSTVLIGHHIAKSGKALPLASILYFSYLVILAICAVMFGASPEDINTYFPNVSRNGVSAAAIFLQIFYSTAYFREKKEAPLITPVITLLICILCYGRSGSGFGFALLIASCAQVIIGKRSFIQPLIALVIGSALMAYALAGPQISAAIRSVMASRPAPVIVTQPAPSVGSKPAAKSTVAPASTPPLTTRAPVAPPPAQTAYSGWSRAGLQSVRWRMASEYVSALDLKAVVLGGALTASPAIVAHNMNPHNSFIRGHAYFGIAYLVLIATVFFSALRRMKGGDIFLVTLLGIYAGRAFFDAFSLFDCLDFVFFFTAFSISPPKHQPQEEIAGQVPLGVAA